MTKTSLQNCADEPIHTPEAIQPHGYLLAIDPYNGVVHIHSANAEELFSKDIVIGQTSIEDLTTNNKSVLPRISKLYEKSKTDHKRRVFNLESDDLTLNPSVTSEVHCSAYTSGDYLVLELELSNVDKNFAKSHAETRISLQQSLPDLDDVSTLNAMANEISRSVKRVTGFDRVMVYKLDHDNHGQVIGEAKESALESFYGLHFPASDIPAQARRLYERNWVRLISNIDAAPVPLVPHAKEKNRAPLDMSDSLIRAVSPIHIEYLRNMGVQATMSISLINNGQLWGLIACHHYSPHYVPQLQRLDCAMLGQMYSWLMSAKEHELSQRSNQIRYNLVDCIIDELSASDDMLAALKASDRSVLNLMNACGFVFLSGGSIMSIGDIPPEPIVRDMIEVLLPLETDNLIATNHLAIDYKVLPELNKIGGALIVPLSIQHDHMAVWFRKKITQTINWAGRDVKPDAKSPTERLTPRGSFDLWQETVKNKCQPWSSVDYSLANRFGRLFVSHVIEKKLAAEKNLLHLRELNQAKDSFLASISHELRSPLNAILGWAELALIDKSNTDKAFEAIKVIKRNAINQADLINDLLDLSRITSGTMKLYTKPVNMKQLVEEICKSLCPEANSKHIELTTNIRGNEFLVEADSKRIKQVITNLINNAIKFTPKNGKISAETYTTQSFVVTKIIDDGIGISDKSINHVFDKFYQPVKSHGKKGLGLGLAIAKQLVELHNGEISVFSRGAGLGACFTVKLPKLKNQHANDGIASRRSTKVKFDLNGLNILVVDDEIDTNRFLVSVLSNYGGKVTKASNGREAWNIISKGKLFDLVITDIAMPIEDGYELLRRIRTHDSVATKNMSIIALSSHAYEADKQRALDTGFNSYISKPVEIHKLLRAIVSLHATALQQD